MCTRCVEETQIPPHQVVDSVPVHFCHGGIRVEDGSVCIGLCHADLHRVEDSLGRFEQAPHGAFGFQLFCHTGGGWTRFGGANHGTQAVYLGYPPLRDFST